MTPKGVNSAYVWDARIWGDLTPYVIFLYNITLNSKYIFDLYR